MIQRGAGMAVWSQIAEDLTAKIRDGRMPPGARLPSEAELAQDYAVNRHTLRRALEEMTRRQLIRTEHGRGSFVAEEVLDYQLGRRPRFSEWVRRHNREPEGRKLSLRIVDAAALAEAGIITTSLGLDPEAAVIELERLGQADGRPVALSRHLFPARPDLFEALEAEATITAALARIGIADYLRRQSRIGSRMPGAREARLLRLEPSIPVLACENINTTPAGTPTEICFVIYPASRVQLIVEPGA